MNGEVEARSLPPAYVTGGTRGIGRAIAARLAEDGRQVTVCGSSRESVEACRAWASERGSGIEAEQVDVRDEAALAASMAAAGSRMGGFGVLVHAVGRPLVGGADTLDRSDWDACLALNLGSAFSAVRTALEPLRQVGGGSVVFVSSIWAHTATRNRAAYITAKTGLGGLVRALALDHAPDGIRVNAVAPGFVDTDLLRTSLAGRGGDVEEQIARIARLHPLGRLVRPEDVANTAAFLAGEEAAGITGQTIVVDGGTSIRFSLSEDSGLS